MNRRSLQTSLLCLALLLPGACGDSEPIPPGTIVVDDDHDASIDDKAEHYVVEARPNLRLELRGHELRAQGRQPDAIRVKGRGEYRTSWDGVSPIELGPQTLVPVAPTVAPFPGFVAGGEYAIGAGTERSEGTRSTLDLMWAGQVDVRAARR